MAATAECMEADNSSTLLSRQESFPRKSIQIISDRLYAVEGCLGQTNDVIFTGFPDKARLNVIYFGGDFQNFSELMGDQDTEKFKDEFSLDSIGELLMMRFQQIIYPVHIWVIRPNKYMNQKYVVYNEFLRMTNEGQPSFMQSCIPSTRKEITAIPHLQNLLCNCCKIENERQLANYGPICTAQLPCVLIGFNKGCVVLTKILCEMHTEVLCKSISPFLTYVRDMYWLDSTHNGEEMIWPHDQGMFERVARDEIVGKISFHAFATPFQIGKITKSRSCQEFSSLCEILVKLGLEHSAGSILRGGKIDLQTHFDIIKEFPIKRHK